MSSDAKKEPLLLFGKLKIEWKDIPKKYFTEYYYSAIQIFNRYKRYGFPYSGGWYEQPGYIVELIDAFEHVLDMYSKAEREKQEKRMKHGSRRRAPGSN